MESGHTVVLNVNSTTEDMLRQVNGPHTMYSSVLCQWLRLQSCQSMLAHSPYGHMSFVCHWLHKMSASDAQNCSISHRQIVKHMEVVSGNPLWLLRVGEHASSCIMLQWAKAQLERGHRAPIVLLADKPKSVLNEIVDTIRSETKMDIMAREGVPYV